MLQVNPEGRTTIWVRGVEAWLDARPAKLALAHAGGQTEDEAYRLYASRRQDDLLPAPHASRQSGCNALKWPSCGARIRELGSGSGHRFPDATQPAYPSCHPSVCEPSGQTLTEPERTVLDNGHHDKRHRKNGWEKDTLTVLSCNRDAGILGRTQGGGWNPQGSA